MGQGITRKSFKIFLKKNEWVFFLRDFEVKRILWKISTDFFFEFVSEKSFFDTLSQVDEWKLFSLFWGIEFRKIVYFLHWINPEMSILLLFLLNLTSWYKQREERSWSIYFKKENILDKFFFDLLNKFFLTLSRFFANSILTVGWREFFNCWS
jgi:hypothetical protein